MAIKNSVELHSALTMVLTRLAAIPTSAPEWETIRAALANGARYAKTMRDIRNLRSARQASAEFAQTGCVHETLTHKSPTVGLCDSCGAQLTRALIRVGYGGGLGSQGYGWFTADGTFVRKAAS